MFLLDLLLQEQIKRAHKNIMVDWGFIKIAHNGQGLALWRNRLPVSPASLPDKDKIVD